ncbi:MAG: GntR family transcriptional regulator [Spirochaetaceae bacterium]|nr:GntR family transcriptional regulator [Spirochaetaceae bacterium]
MNYVANSEVPLFVQIATNIEENIFLGVYKDDTQIPSTTELSVGYKINPATVLKGMNLLVENSIIYKKRGIGMFVCEGAREIIREKRLKGFNQAFIVPLIAEAKKLSFSNQDIIKMINKELGK